MPRIVNVQQKLRMNLNDLLRSILHLILLMYNSYSVNNTATITRLVQKPVSLIGNSICHLKPLFLFHSQKIQSTPNHKE